MAVTCGFDPTQSRYRIGNHVVSLVDLRRFFRMRFRCDSITDMILEAHRRYTRHVGGERIDAAAAQQWTREVKFENKMPPFVLAIWYAEVHANGDLEKGFRLARQCLTA